MRGQIHLRCNVHVHQCQHDRDTGKLHSDQIRSDPQQCGLQIAVHSNEFVDKIAQAIRSGGP